MVEYFGGALGVLDPPVHGRASRIRVVGGRFFDGLPREFAAGRYHSLVAIRDRLPAALLPGDALSKVPKGKLTLRAPVRRRVVRAGQSGL